jgi:signal transduction histidine kinase
MSLEVRESESQPDPTTRDRASLKEIETVVRARLSEIVEETVSRVARRLPLRSFEPEVASQLASKLERRLVRMFETPSVKDEEALPYADTSLDVSYLLVAALTRAEQRIERLLEAIHEKEPDRLDSLRTTLGRVVDGEIRLLSTFHQEELVRRTQLFATLRPEFFEALPRRDVFGILLDRTCTGLRIPYGEIWRPDKKRGVVRRIESWAVDPGGFAELRDAGTGLAYAPDEGIPGKVWSRNAILRLGDLARDESDPRSATAVAANLRSVIGIPISTAPGRVAAVEVLFQRTCDAWNEDLVRLLRAVAGNCAAALRQTKVQEALDNVEMQFRQIARNLPGALLLADVGLRHVRFVASGIDTLWHVNCARRTRDMRDFFANIHEHDRDRVLRAFRGPKGLREVDYRILGPEGSLRVVRSSVFPLAATEATPERIASLTLDVTEHAELKEAYVQQKGLALLGEKTSVAAHELKSPLASIVTGLDFVAKKIPAGSPEEEVLRTLSRRVQDLLSTADEILLLGRPRSPVLREVAVVPLLRSVVDEVLGATATGGEAKVEIEIDAPQEELNLPGDDVQLRRAFANILKNALEAIEGRGRVEVRIATEGGRCIISIRDTGSGIPADVRGRLFEPFYSTKRMGSGLGLPLARRVIHAHEGEIRVDSTPGQGTEFRILLPLEKEGRDSRGSRGQPRSLEGREPSSRSTTRRHRS